MASNKKRFSNETQKNPPIILEIWIVAQNGLNIFNQKLKSQEAITDQPKINDKVECGLDHDLFAGFISAINTFTMVIGLDECKILKTRSEKLSFSHIENPKITFVSRSKLNINDDAISRYLECIKSNFISSYGHKINNWSGSLSVFKGIDQIINIDERKNRQ